MHIYLELPTGNSPMMSGHDLVCVCVCANWIKNLFEFMIVFRSSYGIMSVQPCFFLNLGTRRPMGRWILWRGRAGFTIDKGTFLTDVDSQCNRWKEIVMRQLLLSGGLYS